MAWKERRPIWFWFRVGPDYINRYPIRADLLLIGRPDLMGKGDAGRLVLAGLSIELTLRHWYTFQTATGWLTIIIPSIRIRSDADEIARRLAA